MSALAMIAAGLSQAWNTLSLFAVVNSLWLLTTLGIGASPVLVQAGVLAGIALLTVGVIALSVFLVSKVCGKIFGAQPNSHLDLNGDEIGDPQDEEPKKTVADKTEVAIRESENLIQHAQSMSPDRNNAIAKLEKSECAYTALTNVITVSTAEVQATKVALESCLALVSQEKYRINDPENLVQHMLENIQELDAPAKLALEFSQNSQRLNLACDTARQKYQASIPDGGEENSGDPDLLEAWREAWEASQAYQAYKSDFDLIQGKLTAIEQMKSAEVQEALEEKIPEKGFGPA